MTFYLLVDSILLVTTPTDQRILETARALIQTRGYSAFSYADISAALGITKASIHYHFPSKAALGLEIVRQYRRLFKAGIAQQEARTNDPVALLQAYFAFHQGLAAEDRLCVCLMLATETEQLDDEITLEVRAYFAESLDWLTRTLESGRKSGAFTFSEKPKALASRIQAAVEGALVLSRAFKEPSRVAAVARGLLEAIRS